MANDDDSAQPPRAATSRITARQVGKDIILSVRLGDVEAINLVITQDVAAELRDALAAAAQAAYAPLTSEQLLEAPPLSTAADPLTMIRSKPDGGAIFKIAIPGHPVVIEYGSGALQQISDVVLGLLTSAPA